MMILEGLYRGLKLVITRMRGVKIEEILLTKEKLQEEYATSTH
jgi:hypothetical protein